MKRLLNLLINLLILLLISTSIFAADDIVISIVLSYDKLPYKKNLFGFNEYLKKKKIKTTQSVYHMEQKDKDSILAGIMKDRPQVIFVIGAKALNAFKGKFSNIPIVFCLVPKTIRNTIAKNMAGVSMNIPDEIKIDEIKKVLPNTKSIGTLYSPGSSSNMVDLANACKKTGVTLNKAEVASDQEISLALKEIMKKSNCFLMISDTKIYHSQTIKFLFYQSIKNKIPVVGLSSYFTRGGALMSIECDYNDTGAQAAEILLSIKKGTPPDKIGLIYPRSTELSLNLIVAEKMEIELSDEIIGNAAKVFLK